LSSSYQAGEEQPCSVIGSARIAGEGGILGLPEHDERFMIPAFLKKATAGQVQMLELSPF